MHNMIHDSIITNLMTKPYWIIDILPKQVPAGDRGQYFMIEQYFLQSLQWDTLCRKFANLIIKLNCYHDIAVSQQADEWKENPSPADLTEWLATRKPLQVILPLCDALITFNGDDHYMTIFNPDDRLLELVTALASAEGLFVWKPKQQ